MALTVKSIDEETTALADVYDGLIAPKKLMRNHNNKLYLLLRAYAAGKVGLNDVALALRNRFNPLYCDDLDLHSTAKMVGTDYKQGTGSLLRITVLNKDEEEQKTFVAGTYRYQSPTGEIFSFDYPNDYAFDPQEEKIISAISQDKGSFPVGHNNNIKLFRSDGTGINGAFAFSCEDNSSQLGYVDEDDFAFRLRILNDGNRQDHLKELELKIRNLPNIFECNLKLNDTITPQDYDGITLAPRELLVTITGVPTKGIAELVAEDVIYATHKINDEQVVYYENPLYVSGKYPVYFKYHDKTNFSLAISYQYDNTKLKSTQVEDAISTLFKPFTQMVTHLDVFSEKDAYNVMVNLNLPNVEVLDANIVNDAGEEVPYVRIPVTRLPNLTTIAFTPVEAGSMGGST
jgi:hypothetical protein